MEKAVGHATGASSSREAVIRALDNCYDPCCQDRKSLDQLPRYKPASNSTGDTAQNTGVRSRN